MTETNDISVEKNDVLGLLESVISEFVHQGAFYFSTVK